MNAMQDIAFLKKRVFATRLKLHEERVNHYELLLTDSAFTIV